MRQYAAVSETLTRRTESFSASLLAVTLALMPEALAVLDEDGRYVMVSPGFTKHFGWLGTQVTGRYFTAFLDERDHAAALAAHDAAMRGSEPAGEAEQQQRLRCADGSLLLCGMRSRVLEAGGRLYRVVLLAPQPREEPCRVIAGWLQIVGIEEAREQLGGRGEAVAERVFTTAEAVIRRRLDRSDLLSRTEDGFVIRFAGLSADEAALKAAALSEEVTRRLVGEVAESASHTIAFTAELPAPAEQDPGAALQTLQLALIAAQSRALGEASGLLAMAAANASLRVDPVVQPNGRHSGLLIADVDDGVERRLTALAALGWTGQEPDLPAELLLLRVGLACAWLAQADRATALIVPGPWTSFCQRRVLERVARALWDVPRTIRERLGFELRGLPPDVSRARLGELVGALTSLGRPPSVELPSPASAGLLEGVVQRLGLVSIHADALLLPGVARAQALVRELTAWRTRLLVHGLDQEEQLVSLYSLNVPLFAGRALDGGDPQR